MPIRAAICLSSLLLYGNSLQAQSSSSIRLHSANTTGVVNSDAVSRLPFRNIGPAVTGGRVVDVAVDKARPETFYVATASAGVYRTRNNGTTFSAVLQEHVFTIGAIAIAPSLPTTLYVGTGEANNRQSSAWGSGVYKSLDGGDTWIPVGLPDTHHIGRIVVHPYDADTVYVAALGHLWGSHAARGLYKTTDGGKSWTNTKFINDDTGFVDVAMDHTTPQTLYAAAYQRRRTSFGFNGGGPGSGIWKTIDGGTTWKKLSNGLPLDGAVGRIGLDIYQRDTRIIYATVEHATEGGVYRSNDRGESWMKMSSTNPRPSYYSQIRIDPSNDERIWLLGAQMFYSEDGGKTFVTNRAQKIHEDFHALWINPADAQHMITGSDGGICTSYDGGRTWGVIDTLPLAQVYQIGADLRNPYHVCAGMQDNGTWCGPSATGWSGGIINDDWYRIAGGDGFHVAVDPSDDNTIFVESQNGNLQRIDRRTLERRFIRPEPPAGRRYRFNWNAPFVLSRFATNTVYHGGNRLFRSTDRGDTWTQVSPDLTNDAERDTMTIFGQTSEHFLSRNDGVTHFGTITTIAESPLSARTLWVGTDDGNLHVSTDAGSTWTNVSNNIGGVPIESYVSAIAASRTGDGVAYVAFDRHRNDDFAPYVFRTSDFGKTWEPISEGLPRAPVYVVREHPLNSDVLFAGTQMGLFVTWNRGRYWQRMTALPPLPVSDLLVHERDGDLIIATHARGVYILDDARPLARLPDAVRTKTLFLFEIRPAMQYRVNDRQPYSGHRHFAAANPPEGALITYYVRPMPAVDEKVMITITDSDGTVVRDFSGPGQHGLNRTSWDLRHAAPVASAEPAPQEPAVRGAFVLPGTYMVTVRLGTFSATRSVIVSPDPRLNVSERDRRLWYETAQRAGALWEIASTATTRADELAKKLAILRERFGSRQAGTPDDAIKALDAVEGKVRALALRLSRQTTLGFAGAALASESDTVLSKAKATYLGIEAITASPTEQQVEAIRTLMQQLNQIVVTLNTIIEVDFAALHKLLLLRETAPALR